MYTKIKRTDDGKEFIFLTQQYEVGTYCIVNSDPSQQFGVQVKEEKFHADLRKKAIKHGDKVLAGSILPAPKKSKYDINKFEEA
jgi:hypothetical protein